MIPAVNITVPRHHIKRAVTWIALDVAVMVAVYLLVYSARLMTVPPADLLRLAPAALVAALAMVAALYLAGVYHQVWLHSSGHQAGMIVNAALLATAAMLAVDVLLYPRPLPVSVIAIGNALAASAFIALRYRVQFTAGPLWHPLRPRQAAAVASTRLLIVGAGEAGQMLALQFQRHSQRHQYTVVGFIDDDPRKQGLFIEGFSVLGPRQVIPQVVGRCRVSLIAVAIHNIPGQDFRDILALCEATNARIKLIPDLFGSMATRRNTPLLRDVRPEDLIGRSVIRPNKAIDLTPVLRKTVLVTGAAGSIGSELCRQLLTYEPERIVLLDNNESGLHDLVTELGAHFPETEFVPVLADITVRRSVEAVLRRFPVQVLFHAAAYKHVPLLQFYPDEVLRVNIGGTRSLAELARDYGVARFVLISTDKAVDPASVMGASKRICELIVQALGREPGHSTRFTAVRFGNVLGSRGSVLPTFERQIASGGPVTVTHPEMTRYFMSIPEAASLVIQAACLTEGNDIFLLRMGDVVRIVELAERMIRLRGLRPYEDINIRFTGVRPGEKLHETLHTAAERPLETVHPGIIKLLSDSAVPAEELFARLDDLLASGIDSPEGALARLRAVVHDSAAAGQFQQPHAAG